MNSGKKIIGVLIIILLSSHIFAQSDWRTEITEDGQITVTSKISRRTDDVSNEQVQLIEYVATTTAHVSFQNCISIMKDISKHKEILNENVSEMLKTISDHEWLIYYYFDSPWPLPNSDCVTKMNFSEDKANGIATFTLIAEPASYEKRDVKRLTYYNVSYTFKDLGNGKVEITSTARLSPIIQAPDWLVRGFFPEGPARYLQRLVVLAKNT